MLFRPMYNSLFYKDCCTPNPQATPIKHSEEKFMEKMEEDTTKGMIDIKDRHQD